MAYPDKYEDLRTLQTDRRQTNGRWHIANVNFFRKKVHPVTWLFEDFLTWKWPGCLDVLAPPLFMTTVDAVKNNRRFDKMFVVKGTYVHETLNESGKCALIVGQVFSGCYMSHWLWQATNCQLWLQHLETAKQIIFLLDFHWWDKIIPFRLLPRFLLLSRMSPLPLLLEVAPLNPVEGFGGEL